ncbi:HET domain containing protein pin-c1 [Pyrenophora tritici-repentis]|nr:HET domain-containing protein pin-c1 [Pyrenophora tritici-repentis]KAI2476385.1 HET domain containing protein pin-c1 [Pyrenophora tritici-repentis]
MIYTEAGRAFRRAIWSQANTIDIKARSATIRAWLTECQTHHLACRKNEKPEAPVAARILAIQENTPGNFLIRLVTTESIDLRSEPHLVLSHVWGGIEIKCKTTSARISQYQDIGIDFDTLPKTFQDAVQITAAIGFRYLWIDSLCIIQDDDEDWQRESAKMAAIFHTGTITLSATSAKNGTEGCGLAMKPGRTMRFSHPHSRGLDFIARETTETIASAATILDNHLRNAPVSTRAWILQEQKLSRRILHAMDSQLVWVCSMITESEDSIVYKQENKAPKITSQAHLDSRVPCSYQSGNENSSLPDIYESGYHWWKCVEDYSTRSLTYPADRYAALAGIVQFHQERTGDSPVVGLWKQNLAIHLGWAVYHDPREHITPLWDAANRRPSWTWMSFLHGSVRTSEPISWSMLQTAGSREGDLGIVYQAHILHTDVKWSSRPLTSDPRGSTIRIRGMMHRRPRPKPLRTGIRSPLHLDPGVAEPGDESGVYNALALFAQVQSATLRNHPPYVTTTYLIIKPTSSENKNEYMRIGRMQLTEPFNMDLRHKYLPEGIQRDITLV